MSEQPIMTRGKFPTGGSLGIGILVSAIVLFTVCAAATEQIEQSPAVDTSATPVAQRSIWLPGQPWTGRTVRSSTGTERSQAEIEQFEAFPLFWLGPEFGGYNLQDMWLQKPSEYEKHRAADKVLFSYGTCDFRQTNRCPSPASVTILSNCDVRLEDVDHFVRAGAAKETVRGGATLLRLPDNQTLLWTGRAMVSIDAAAVPTLMDQALQRLQGISRQSAGIGPGAPLPPPDFSHCPPRNASPGQPNRAVPAPSATLVR